MTTRFVDNITAREALDLIRNAGRCYISAHVAPDGDALGSALGLYWALTQMGKTVRVACADPVPEMFDYLPGAHIVRRQKPDADELLLLLDSSDLQRLGSLYDETLFRDRPIVNIDHHVTNVRFGTVNWVEPAAASTAEIITELVRALDAPLDPRVATCLLTGMATDTLGFRTSSTSPALMETAAELMRAGAPLSEIIERSFNTRDLSDLRLQGHVLAAMQVEDGVIWSDCTLQMRRESGSTENGSGGLANMLLSVRGAKVAVMFIEKDREKVEISLRARPGHNISGVAFNLGGGGHPQAAGATLSLSMADAHHKVLPLVRAALDPLR
ncbi:MAG: bifunctional oligoribonuclease/PAP phosphatase NrnA [Chloroflexi bacterium]|nr:bifunctional oligoribonuclease/PAP phosphatase NrnA [Chloroflexota bacterium]